MIGAAFATWIVLMASPDPGNALKVDLGKVGTVELPNSCAPAVQEQLQRAAALLHGFFYEEARLVFAAAAAREPRCAMAHGASR